MDYNDLGGERTITKRAWCQTILTICYIGLIQAGISVGMYFTSECNIGNCIYTNKTDLGMLDIQNSLTLHNTFLVTVNQNHGMNAKLTALDDKMMAMNLTIATLDSNAIQQTKEVTAMKNTLEGGMKKSLLTLCYLAEYRNKFKFVILPH